MNAVPLRIIKIGGSLLTWPGLPAALRHWLTTQPSAMYILVCGGGSFADAVREADHCHHLGEVAAHWLCIDAMHVTARLLSELLPETSLCASFAELKERIHFRAAQTIVFDPREFLRVHEPQLPGLTLPQNWSATSDSIAARLAVVLSAEELVLLKSTDPPAAAPASSLPELAAADFVDRHFPEAARTVSTVSFVNLRTVLPVDPCLLAVAPTIR